jgi:hypothetical protein
MREFMDKVKEDTGQDIESIRSHFSHSQLMKGFGMISNSSFLRIQELVEDMITSDIISLPPHKEFNIEEWIEDNFLKYKAIFDKMYKSYSKKLWKFIFDKFVILYIQYLLISSLKYDPEDLEEYVQKVKEERELIDEVFSEVLSEKNVALFMKRLDLLIEALTMPSDRVVVCIVNLRISMKNKNFNTKCMKCILRMRHDIVREEKIAMMKIMEEQGATIKQRERRDLGKLFKQTIMVDNVVQSFVQKFKARYEMKMEAKRRKAQNQLNNDLLKINENERLVIEEESMSLRGFLGISKKKFKDYKKKDFIIKNLQKFKYSKMHVSFLDDIIQWKKKPTSKSTAKRIYLVTIDDIGVVGDRFIWLTKENELYSIQCASDEERRHWIKALIFLREESMSEIKPLEFREFACVDQSKFYDEIFDCDDINYEYEHIKIVKRKEKVKKAFNMEEMEMNEEEINEAIDEGIKERSVEELSSSSEAEEEMESSEEDEEEDEELDDAEKMKRKVKKQAKKTYKKEVKRFRNAVEEFKTTHKETGNLYDSAKKYFGFY